MSKKVLLMLPISLMILATASCSWLTIKRDYAAENNPIRILAKRNNSGDHYIRYNGRDLKGDIVDKVLYDVDYTVEYTLYKGTPELSGDSFELCLQVPSFWVPSYKSITFYECGYAQTGYYDYDKKVSYTYYYEFNKELAKIVCDEVKDEYDYIVEEERREREERDRVEREYNEMIEDMTILTIIDKMKESERVDLRFFFVTKEEEPRYFDFTFKDDGSIYDALKSAEYSEADRSVHEEDAMLANLQIISSEWCINIDRQSRYVLATFETKDKYYRNYSKRIEKTIDTTSINYIMNRAYELGAPTNPFGNSSSNPSSSSEE